MKKLISAFVASILAVATIPTISVSAIVDDMIFPVSSEDFPEESIIDNSDMDEVEAILDKYNATYEELFENVPCDISVSQPIATEIMSTSSYANYGLGDVNMPTSEFNSKISALSDSDGAPYYFQSNYPSSIDLSTSAYFPPIGDQGILGSCVSWATTYYQFTYEANKLNNINTTYNNSYSPAWMFNMINNGRNTGSTNVKAYNVLKRNGAVHTVDVPYYSNNFSYSWYNDTEKLIEALNTRLSSVYAFSIDTSSDRVITIADSQLDEIKGALADGKIVNIRVSSSGGLSNWKTKPIISGGTSGEMAVYCAVAGTSGHAMTIVGYDDRITCDINNDGYINPGERGAFKVANSWGSNWMNNGYVWVMYDALNKTSCAASEANLTNRISIFDRDCNSTNNFYTIEVENKDINLVGLLNVNVSNRYNWTIKTGKGSANDIIFENAGSVVSSPFTGTLVVDYLDCDDSINTNVSNNWYVSLMNGTGSSTSYGFNYKIVDNKQNIIKNFDNINTGSISPNGTVTKNRAITFKMGDLNYDGQITEDDANIIFRYDAGVIELSNLQKKIGDTNGSGEVTVSDGVYILQMLARG